MAPVSSLFEHRKFGHPENFNPLGVVELAGAAKVIAQRTQRRMGDSGAVRHHQHAVADLRAGGRGDGLKLGLGEELGD